MKEFTKIFLVLCAIVGAFFIGRNFGEDSAIESTEIKTLKSENFQNRNAQIELENLKEKFQKLLDSSDLKKANEVLAKVMTIFLADLSLHLSDQQQKDFNEGRMACMPAKMQMSAQKDKASLQDEPDMVSNNKTTTNVKLPSYSTAKFKSSEEGIFEASNTDQIKELLKDVEVKKIDNLLNEARGETYAESKKFIGTYRGSIIDVTNNIYGTLIMETQPAEENILKGSIEIYKGGKRTDRTGFNTNSIGYAGNNSKATLISVGGDYLQVYKIESSQKIAGIYYERLPNGTSKVIGTFVLSRTDFID